MLITSVVPDHCLAGPGRTSRKLSVHLTASSVTGYAANTDWKRIGVKKCGFYFQSYKNEQPHSLSITPDNLFLLCYY